MHRSHKMQKSFHAWEDFIFNVTFMLASLSPSVTCSYFRGVCVFGVGRVSTSTMAVSKDQFSIV